MAKKAHFDAKLFAFLRELRAHNEREWFEAHKERYLRDVSAPLQAFVLDFAPHLAKISKRFVADPRPSGGSIFRIYRDTRFTKDKSPYKTMAAIRARSTSWPVTSSARITSPSPHSPTWTPAPPAFSPTLPASAGAPPVSWSF